MFSEYGINLAPDVYDSLPFDWSQMNLDLGHGSNGTSAMWIDMSMVDKVEKEMSTSSAQISSLNSIENGQLLVITKCKDR